MSRLPDPDKVRQNFEKIDALPNEVKEVIWEYGFHSVMQLHNIGMPVGEIRKIMQSGREEKMRERELWAV